MLRQSFARLVASLAVTTYLCAPRSAFAYRPFDGTDAAVAELHKFELEIGPVGYYRQGNDHYLVTPGGVLNYGFANRLELVLQGFGYLRLDGGVALPSYRTLVGGSRFQFTDTGLFVKGVLREGCLQDRSGVSLATEIGPLLPTLNDQSGFGGYAGFIATTCTSDLIVHWNTEVQILRETQDLDLFGGAILEAPASLLVVRPVAELFVEHDFGGLQTYSALVGAIWTVSDKLALDAAMRVARVNDEGVGEIRLGFSWTIP